MEVGDYVLYNDHAWLVLSEHKRAGTYTIVRLHGSPVYPWGKVEVSEGVCTVITKEVADVFIACKLIDTIKEPKPSGWVDARGFFTLVKGEE